MYRISGPSGCFFGRGSRSAQDIQRHQISQPNILLIYLSQLQAKNPAVGLSVSRYNKSRSCDPFLTPLT